VCLIIFGLCAAASAAVEPWLLFLAVWRILGDSLEEKLSQEIDFLFAD
jgi:hypothetical protein